MPSSVEQLVKQVSELPLFTPYGTVHAVEGLSLEVTGIDSLSVGMCVQVSTIQGKDLLCEVVGFRAGRARCMPFGDMRGVIPGALVRLAAQASQICPSMGWRGRIINGLGMPVDGLGALPRGAAARNIHAAPPSATERAAVGERVDIGVRALNLFVPCCRGQRLGIFAASGVGKSLLLATIARYVQCDTIVVGLIGERGREVREFTQQHLTAQARQRAVVVVATSDEPALVRKQAAELTLCLAEYFRDEGHNVLCLIDSVTRFATAQREIGLASAEPPTTRGYPPSVFSQLPRLLERAGPGRAGCGGSITGLFTVLVEGDDHDEPVSDAVRAILDGHIVLDRSIGERGRFPAIDVLRSVSRTAPQCLSRKEEEIWSAARRVLATYRDVEELVRIGAYRRGSDAEVDTAIHQVPLMESLLAQGLESGGDIASNFQQLEAILATQAGTSAPADAG